MSEFKEKRQSYIEKKVEFVINVDNFESLRVGTTFGETIEWASPEERQKKLDALTKSIAQEVAKDAKEIMLSYGLKRKSSSQVEKKNKVNFSALDDISDDKEDGEKDEDIKL